MKLTTRIYMDAALQNMKSVSFFTFLQVLIARLGASNFEIALSNSLPPLFCALSLAFLTRQLPVTRGVFLASGYVRQAAFLCMAFAALLPHPVPFLLFFWCINAVAVMITGAQQPAIMRKWVAPDAFPQIFSNNKIIGIVIVTLGSFGIGQYLDAFDWMFPKNYVFSMLVGCLATFAGMSLIAELAPKEKQPIRLSWMRPLQECDRKTWWMGLNNVGIAMVAPLFVIYHVNVLKLSNSQIAYFVVTAGIVSTLLLPVARRCMERFGVLKVYGTAVIGMALAVLPYGFVHSFWLLLVIQGWVGVCLAVHEVASQTMMMKEAAKHKKEMAYFSDFQLVMNAGNAVGALAAGALISFLPMWGCFIVIALSRVFFYLTYRSSKEAESHQPSSAMQQAKSANG
ncbi:MFS transporter [Paenibacillus doosanensis]|uniref:Major Facilitator Superfamily protein n=1 Tax=Paenibacillus konkukensis TaxID=2020716 RepID=A0ABY4RTN4_9BACL|nr:MULTISPECIES: MFS transporter [Paenibacillus]MCS7460755.1 MFS transporter [Paenibacillus doosanensis]UQZ85936.1 Major Facilitator Superfamily protein [Paenibacillus konkukensis]